MAERKNNIFIISAPSGTGKSTLIQFLLAQIADLFFSISHTTRPPRVGEKDGVEYFFVDSSQFEEMIQKEEFLEWAKVHGYFYGTSRKMIDLAHSQHKDLVLDVDIQGAANIRRLLPEAVSIFIMPPSYEMLRQRLVLREKDTAEQILERLETASLEIQHYREYEYVVINEDLSSAFESLASIIRGQRSKRQFLEEKIRAVLKSFDIR